MDEEHFLNVKHDENPISAHGNGRSSRAFLNSVLSSCLCPGINDASNSEQTARDSNETKDPFEFVSLLCWNLKRSEWVSMQICGGKAITAKSKLHSRKALLE
jgi:hypothetical protein